jgi:hypothetical protein
MAENTRQHVCLRVFKGFLCILEKMKLIAEHMELAARRSNTEEERKSKKKKPRTACCLADETLSR